MEIGDSVLNLPDETRMLDAVRDGLSKADDVRIAVAFTRCSGLQLLFDALRDVAKEKHGRVRVLTSTYRQVTQPAALESLHRLSADVRGVEARLQDGPAAFHSKFWWLGRPDGGECWAGSSNLTKGGLDTNVEWNVRRTDDASMKLTAAQFDALWRRPDVKPLDPASIRRYDAIYKRALAARPPFSVADAGAVVEPNAAQIEALASLSALRGRGERRAAVIAATGVGKTHLAAFDVRASGAKTALFVSNRLEHLLQAERTFRSVFGTTRTVGVVGAGRDETAADIVCSTVIGVVNRPELARRSFDYLVIDEFHHAGAPSYEVLRPLRERAFLLGMTATPERQDDRNILEWTDRNVAYEIRLPEAIDRGWLLPFHYFGVADETIQFEDFPWRELDQIEDRLSVEARAEYVLKRALELGYDGPKRVTIGFCAGVRHARFMAESFRRRGQVTEVVLGDQPAADRERVYRRLEDPSDPLEWVFVSDVLNEGVDIPAINSVLFLRPTESPTVFLQQLGRGLRLFPGTRALTVLDFVGHHRSAWLPLRALDAPGGGGRRVEITKGVLMQPPRACEVVLERRTREILEKIARFPNRREECHEAYLRLRGELGRAPMPADLSRRSDVPELAKFRAAYGTWLECQRAHGDEPPFAAGLGDDHPAPEFLRSIEADWQAQRVAPYALVWGLARHPKDPAKGYEEFFDRYSRWRVEKSALFGSGTWKTVRRKLDGALVGSRLSKPIRDALGDRLLPEVEGRILYTIDADHRRRHEGVLRTPADLHLFARYDRPEIVRHFGVHFDPAKHNTGLLWFGDDGVIITKLDTSSAIRAHQYKNRIIDDVTLEWTSQPKMAPDNAAGRKVADHAHDGRTLRLFVQRRSHELTFYLGGVRALRSTGAKPMTFTLRLARAIPEDVRRALAGDLTPV